MAEARRKDLLARAEDEALAKAETYREREEAHLEHRRLEINSQEERLAQRARQMLRELWLSLFPQRG